MSPYTKQDLRKPLAASAALDAAIEAFYRRCYAKNLSASTLSYYRHRLNAFKTFLQTRQLDLAPEEITPAIIRDFLANETERVSAVTASHSYITLRALFRFLVSDDLLLINPMEKVAKIRLRKKLVQTFSPEQIHAMLSTADNNFPGLRLRAILITFLDCGLRVSELCCLEIHDILWHDQTLRVLGKGNKERLVPFGGATMRALKSYLARRGNIEGTESVFVTCYGDPLTRHRIAELISVCGRQAGINNVRCSPHTFRHTCAVMYLRNGGDVFSLQKLLGHADLTMTRRYAELSQTDVVAKHRQFSPGDSLQLPTTRGRQRIR